MVKVKDEQQDIQVDQEYQKQFYEPIKVDSANIAFEKAEINKSDFEVQSNITSFVDNIAQLENSIRKFKTKIKNLNSDVNDGKVIVERIAPPRMRYKREAALV